MQIRTMIIAVLGLTRLLQTVGGVRLEANDSEALPDERNVSSEPLAIVVNQSNQIGDLWFVELRRVFPGERSHWPNGRRITMVMREPGEPGEPDRRTILHDVCGMNEEQFKTHILGGLFAGDILVSPKILTAPAGVRQFIFNVPGAIGYLRMADVDATVKVLRIDKLLPEDRGYKLHIKAEAVN